MRSWRQMEITFPKLGMKGKENLMALVSDDEIKRAIFHMQPWKAQGPDGFPVGFVSKGVGDYG